MPVHEHALIRYLTYRLPYNIANQLFKEYEDRMKEIDWLLENSRQFIDLRENKSTIELLLAISIFHKRIISNLDSASKFYSLVTKNSEAESVRIGRYDLTGLERNKLLATILNFNQIMSEYNIPLSFTNYYATREFLTNVKRLKNAEAQN
jgi:hypothetical protein